MVDDQQARLLRAIWSHRLSTGGWIPVRLLHSMQGGKAHVRPQLAGLGGAVVFESEEAGTPTYGLTLLGTLLSDDGARLERLLTDFLALARSLALKEPLRTHVSSTEAAKALGLSHVGIMELGHLIRLSPFHHGGSFGRDEWNVELPRDIEDVPPEPGGYVAQAAVEGYDPAIPLDSSERRIYSSQPRTGLQSISLLAVPPFALPPEEEMARRLTDSLLLSIADDIERKLTRRSFERLLVDRGLYSLSVLSEEMGEYSGLSKRDLIRTVLMELRSGFNTGRLLEALAEEKVLTPDTWQALEEAGYPRPIHREPAKSRAKRPARAPSSATPKKGSTRSGPRARALPKGKRRWDVFLSHASEDKAAIARPLPSDYARRVFPSGTTISPFVSETALLHPSITASPAPAMG